MNTTTTVATIFAVSAIMLGSMFASASPGDPVTSADMQRIARAIEANTAAIREAGRQAARCR